MKHGIRLAVVGLLLGCSANEDPGGFDPRQPDDGSGAKGGALASAGGSGPGVGGFNAAGGSGAGECGPTCSYDGHDVLDCRGNVVQECQGADGCDDVEATCADACAVAVKNRHAVGCEYWATFMDTYQEFACFAAFVANTWDTPAHITVDYAGVSLPVGTFAYLPKGAGPTLTYEPFDASAGIPPGEVAILFLGGPQLDDPPPLSATCPMPSAVPYGAMLHKATGVGASFRIGSDVPVVAYQINPYGGGSAAVTAASLLLPTSVWDTDYVAVNVYEHDIDDPSMNIVATEDDTQITFWPTKPVLGGGGIPSGQPNVPLELTLNRGEHAQITQPEALTGSCLLYTSPSPRDS